MRLTWWCVIGLYSVSMIILPEVTPDRAKKVC